MQKSDLQTETSSYVDKYPQFIEAIDFQKEDLFWTHKEIDLTKDKHDLRKRLNDAQRHAVSFNQRLFTKYEDVIGNDYWIGVVHKKYKNPIIRRLAVCFADVENNIHFPFYRKVNEVLGVHNDEFYSAFETDPVLVERVDFMQKLVSEKDTLASMAGFAFMEGAVLFTAFAMIKSLGVKGQNSMPNLIAGIDFSVLDENHHFATAAEIFKEIEAIDYFDVKMGDFNADLEAGKVKYISDEVLTAFIEEVKKQSVVTEDINRDMAIVYTPLNGTGRVPMTRALKETGLENIKLNLDEETIKEIIEKYTRENN